MENQIVVSVIIPVYNTEKYLEQCLDSVIASIGEGNAKVQVILIDDGSTDQCAEICDSYATRHAFVRCIHQQNEGVSSARNSGLEVAEGEYIAWVDSDDYVAENWLHQIFEVIETERPDVIVFDSLRVEADKNVLEVYGRKEGLVPIDILRDDIARDIRVLSGLPNKVIHKSCYQNIRFGQEAILEDYQQIFSILKGAKTAYYIPQLLYFYRQQESSIIHSSTPEQSFLCVNMAMKRKKALYPEFQTATTIGVAVQMVRFCRARGYDDRYLPWDKEYKFCRDYIKEHIGEILHDKETPTRWKLKFCLLSVGLLPQIVKMKELRLRK